jgi:ATP-dependent DNA helicase DinG
MSWVDDYCILEMVTTGPDPETALPLEVAAIRVLKGSEAGCFHALIDAGVAIPTSLLEKSGRGEGEYRGGEDAGEALSHLRDFLGGRHVLAHEGTDFEAAVLGRFGALPSGPILDTQELSWVVSPYLRAHSFSALASSLAGEEPSWKALEDARLLLRLLALLREAWEEAPRRVREAVAGALEEADSPWRFFLPCRRGRPSFPDLAEMLPRVDETSRRAPAGACRPGAAGRGEGGAIDPEEAAAVLAPGGPLASLLPGHESRPQQAAMAAAVAEALNEAAFLVVEAGTGVGKSLGYLVPGVLYARTAGGPLVVSTYTRNLQEQLFHGDLPMLSRALGAVEFALLKGRGNYLCLRKWAEWCGSLGRGEPVLHFGEHTPSESYAFLASWLSRTATGDLEEISLGLRLLLAELVRELASSSEECLRSNCPHFSRCWVEKARGRAASSEVVVVNHALLLSQLTEAEAGPSNLVLPAYGILVLDEAHHLEDVATDAFSLAFSLEDCLRNLEDVAGRKGVMTVWGKLAFDREGRGMLSEAHELAERSRSQAEELCLRIIAPLLPEAAEDRGGEWAKKRLDKGLLSHPAWEPARETGLDLADGLSRLASLLPGLAEKALALGGRDEEALRAARKAEALSRRAREASSALEVFLREPGCDDFRRHLRWIERGPAWQRAAAPVHIRLRSAPVSVGGELSSTLFAPLESCVLTSASLRVQGARDGFAFFLQRTGLDEVERNGRETRLLALDSPFDYSCQVRLIAVTDLAEPRAGGEAFRRYMRGISRVVEDALLATGGKSLVLLTSHQQVDFLYAELRPRLEEHGLCCLRQRRGMPNALLLERFRADRDSVLLATEAFWEGVDVPGESLSAVIMVKLPFRHPQDPVVAGRVEHHDREGSGGWASYYMPLAVTLFRQGIGRLVRRSTDQGVIVLLDPRFLTRSYSHLFHAALPDGLRVETVRAEELGETIRACFP